MSRPVAARARVRLALVFLVGCALGVLVPSLVTATGEASSAVVLTAVALTLASVLAFGGHATAQAVAAPSPPPCPAQQALPLLGGRVTDPVHHPLRPRAPGLA